MALEMPGVDEHWQAETLNVSASGVAVEVDTEILMAGNVTVAFEGPDEVSEVRCQARIVWVGSDNGANGKPRLGLHFLDISEAERALLRRVLYGSEDARERPSLQAVETRSVEGLTP